ncbi:hypothetical protein FSP39_018813 [Pinctada imbricata]|uniref:Uncharacterized protein n=1 Tax=Pinctada imbricata TaxID=66713 RepID=A0AA88YE47_PINIB|nr:hypothetical protein FSP39_018813 [Pinctada imbricata]
MGVVCSSAKQEEWKKNNSYVAMNKSAEKGGGYNTQEGKCELIGFRYSEKIDHKEITLDKAIKDIVEYTRWYNKQDSRHAQYCWLSLHLALGLCFQYKVSDKEMVRNLLAELLPYSRGIDMGLFMRDLLHYEDISQQNAQLEKTYYFLSFCAGFIVNLEKNGLGDEIFKGPARVEYRDLLRAGECAYLDIPIGHPTVLLTETDNHTGDQCINIACENLKPNVVLVLLQHGKSPFGAIERLLDTLGAVNVVGRTQQQIMVIEAPCRNCRQLLGDVLARCEEIITMF